MKKMYIVLEDGHVFEGKGFGSAENAVGELVFTTSVVGYIETLTDTAYYGQIVMHTFPLIGNYGMISEDALTDKPALNGYIAREFCELPSNFRTETDLETYIKENNIVAVWDVDTREITKLIRENGVMNACITKNPDSVDMDALKAYEIRDAVKAVASNKKGYFKAEDEKYCVAMLDCGASSNALEMLTSKGCSVTVFPYNTSADEILSMDVDGVVITNGPGNPTENTEIIEEVKKLLGKKPMFGFGLGHQLMALAAGAKTEKLKFGHRGGSQPVKNIADGKVFATSQNHGYAVANDSVTENVGKIIFKNVGDGSCEGIEYNCNAYSIQFAPDVFSASVDTDSIYDKFITMMGGDK